MAKPSLLININGQPDSTRCKSPTRYTRGSPDHRLFPRGIQIQPFYDQSLMSIKSIQAFEMHLDRLVLASIILVVFSRDWGTRSWRDWYSGHVSITFIALKLMGQSVQPDDPGRTRCRRGLVIDDAIVVVENIVLHRDAARIVWKPSRVRYRRSPPP